MVEPNIAPVNIPPATLRAYAWEYMHRASLQPLGSIARGQANTTALQLCQAADSGAPLAKAMVWSTDNTYVGARYPGGPTAPHSATRNPHARQ